MTDMTLGNYIERRRKDLLLSRRALARELGMSASHLSGIVGGYIHPGAEVCRRLAVFFRDPPDMVFELAGWMDPSLPTVEPGRDLETRLQLQSLRDDRDWRAIFDAYQQATPSERRALARLVAARQWQRADQRPDR
jgi:transcriptional regulator with XRE-family HTH domain